jgi:hypothetical protein
MEQTPTNVFADDDDAFKRVDSDPKQDDFIDEDAIVDSSCQEAFDQEFNISDNLNLIIKTKLEFRVEKVG